MTTKSFLPVLLIPVLILLIPAAAMLLKIEGWAWDAGSFVIAWVLMTGVGLAYKLVTGKSHSRSYRLATGLALATGFILVWINGAVGLIGSEDNPANQLYAGVLIIGLFGAVLARLEPRGMARALWATALAQLLVPVIAIISWRPDFSPGLLQVLAINFFFVAMFGGSAWLFRHAARSEKQSASAVIA